MPKRKASSYEILMEILCSDSDHNFGQKKQNSSNNQKKKQAKEISEHSTVKEITGRSPNGCSNQENLCAAVQKCQNPIEVTLAVRERVMAFCQASNAYDLRKSDGRNLLGEPDERLFSEEYLGLIALQKTFR